VRDLREFETMIQLHFDSSLFFIYTCEGTPAEGCDGSIQRDARRAAPDGCWQ
jgi:hypothetical protein